MKKLQYVDRETQQRVVEPICCESAMNFFYNSKIGEKLSIFLSKNSLFSRIYGWLQKRSWTKRKIVPFMERYKISEKELQKPVSAYSSFNDFFTRKLRPEVRPISPGANVCTMPADGRYLVYPNISDLDTFVIKSKNFSAAIIYIDGIVDSASINTSILTPLLLRNSITMQPTNVSAVSKNISVKRVQKFNLEDFLFNSLIPQNNV